MLVRLIGRVIGVRAHYLAVLGSFDVMRNTVEWGAMDICVVLEQNK
jgi:hypothetical protein